MQALFWRLVRFRPDAGAFSPPLDRLQQANVLRWSLYRRYLEKNACKFDRVLMVDLRDVCFQDDPFVAVTVDKLRVHAEEGDVNVGSEAWNNLTMHRAFGPDGLRQWGTLKVSCSGVVAGGIKPVQMYLAEFARLLPELRMPDHGTDQAVHVRIIHEGLSSICEWQGNRSGHALNLGIVLNAESIPCDASGNLLNDVGVPFAIVHQFDRHPELDSHLRRRFEKHA